MAYTLLSGIYNHLSQETEFSVLLLGLENAGKTTFLERLKTAHSPRKGLTPEQIIPTIGLNIGKLPNIRGHRLFVCDIGGQLKSLWQSYFPECHGIIFLIDTSDKENFPKSVETFASVLSHSELSNVPILILANKQDKNESLQIDSVLSSITPLVPELGERDCRLQPLSALEGMGVEEGLNWLVQHMELNQIKKPKRLAE